MLVKSNFRDSNVFSLYAHRTIANTSQTSTATYANTSTHQPPQNANTFYTPTATYATHITRHTTHHHTNPHTRFFTHGTTHSKSKHARNNSFLVLPKTCHPTPPTTPPHHGDTTRPARHAATRSLQRQSAKVEAEEAPTRGFAFPSTHRWPVCGHASLFARYVQSPGRASTGDVKHGETGQGHVREHDRWRRRSKCHQDCERRVQ